MADQRVRLGVGVFVFRSHDDNHFVIGRRKGSTGAGTYALPGGHLEHGESFEDCAIREVMEETGIGVDDVQFLTAVNSVFSDTGKHYVTIFMTAIARDRVQMPKLLESDKCDGWSWSTFDELRAMPGDGYELFLPMHSLMQQRSAICDKLVRGPTALDAT
ncbi:nudix hydrolase 1 [Teratosphaeria nubilosa]|uniref:Nudix hydrolase 1 n=1 Tax=Teratosphaeria nubilosa TaxID=161662 RepID=A0A6G1LL43_9PEZI|nr:nudix hydrolase 1 [Teratosphaeria nubilosa]